MQECTTIASFDGGINAIEIAFTQATVGSKV
jgi:hypothetical protein